MTEGSKFKAFTSLSVKSIVAGLPLFLLSLTAFVVVVTGQSYLGISRLWLAQMLKIEFLVIHSFPFITLIALAKPQTRNKKIIQWVGFSGLMCLYIGGVCAVGGWQGLVLFVSLTISTYLGFMLQLYERNTKVILCVRWAVNTTVFLACAMIFRLPSTVNDWHLASTAPSCGLVYFVIITLVEFSGFYMSQRIKQFCTIFVDGSLSNK